MVGTTVPRQWVFLVGGLGTRLGPLTRSVPKPLLEVDGRPFVETLIERAAGAGAASVVLLTGHLAERFASSLHDRVVHGVPVLCHAEPRPLGTAGALRHAASVLEETFILANGDSLFECDVRALAALETPDDWLGRMALRRLEDCGRSGVVTLDGGRVTSFAPRGRPGVPGLVNGGVYLLRRRVLEHIPEGPASLEHHVFPSLAWQGRLFGLASDGFFIDIGTPEDLRRARARGGPTVG